MTFKYDSWLWEILKYDSWLWGISLLILSNVLTRWIRCSMEYLVFELIDSNEIFIRSNKNHHCLLQLNVVMNDIFILFLVIFGTYQIICELFLLRSTIETSTVSCSTLLWKAVILIYFVHFLASEGPCDKQTLTFVVNLYDNLWNSLGNFGIALASDKQNLTFVVIYYENYKNSLGNFGILLAKARELP